MARRPFLISFSLYSFKLCSLPLQQGDRHVVAWPSYSRNKSVLTTNLTVHKAGQCCLHQHR